jgi:hypothetical protein
MIHLTLRDLRTLRPSTTQQTESPPKERRPKRQAAGQSTRVEILPRRTASGPAHGRSASNA